MVQDWVASILNFFVWGSGYLYKGRKTFGLGWLLAYIPAHLPIFYLGWEFYTQVPGMFILSAHIIISLLLAYEVYEDRGK